METVLYFVLGMIGAALNFGIGVYFGRMMRGSSERIISPSKPHPAPSIARRAERIALQAVKREKAEQIKVISPRKRAQNSIVFEGGEGNT